MKFSLCQFCYWIEVLRTGRESNWWSKHEVVWRKQILMSWKFVWTVFLIYFDFSARCTGNRKETILVWKLIDTPKVKRSVYVHVTLFWLNVPPGQATLVLNIHWHVQYILLLFCDMRVAFLWPSEWVCGFKPFNSKNWSVILPSSCFTLPVEFVLRNWC